MKVLTKEARILKLFKEKRRLNQQELAKISLRFGGVIHELRKEGYEIVTVPINYQTGQYEYQFKRGPSKNNRDGMDYERVETEPKSSKIRSFLHI